MVKQQVRLDAVFSALADPTRRRLLTSLSQDGETRVTALARPFRISLPAISKHLRVLEDADLIQRVRSGREHRIRAKASRLKEAQTWITQFVEVWESRFDALDELLKEKRAKGKRP